MNNNISGAILRARRLLGFLFFLAIGMSNPVLAGISDNEIRVGLLVDMNSIYAHITGRGSVVAAEMAIEDAGGKINGKPIRLMHEDHANSIEKVSAIARDWLFEKGVDVIADVASSPLALAVQEINRPRGAVVFYNGVMNSDITGTKCAPTGIHWMYDGYAYNNMIGGELTRSGVKTWYFVTVDNAFGLNVEKSLAALVRSNGGMVLGSVRHPLGSKDFFSELRQASESGAQVIVLVNAGQDLIQSVRQSFDLLRVSKGQTMLAAVATALNDVHVIKPQLAQGMRLTHSFYWNMDAESRAWSKRFFERTGAMPSDLQAGVYSSLTHYFKAVQALDSDSGLAVVKKMREIPIRDPIVRNASLREDGRMVHDLFLLKVKAPDEMAVPWDYLEILRTVPGGKVFRPLAEGGCPLVTEGRSAK
ncbi:MAG: ABC transporter substrate-binding protein [Zoogloeaceae bacterium]|nr:ABC transporter substrate-binding protein [Zoogloeaceae bacterium]